MRSSWLLLARGNFLTPERFLDDLVEVPARGDIEGVAGQVSAGRVAVLVTPDVGAGRQGRDLDLDRERLESGGLVRPAGRAHQDVQLLQDVERAGDRP